jgi:hypothetical protein
MSQIFSWFHSKKTSSSSTTIYRKNLINSFIVHKQLKEFSSYLRQKDDRILCIEGFFQLLPSMLDEHYMSQLFELITKKSGLKSNELSTIITAKLSSAILDKNFDLCEKILHLPFQSFPITLPTYEIIQFIHTCSNSQQLISCLSILIEKNLPYDSEYLSWILIILFEHYLIGDEIIIEYILNMRKHINLLFTCYGNNNVTPLMLFLHIYSNKKCEVLIDHYLSNINDQSILLQCDKWNRSYLMHLLCGRCQHEIVSNDMIEINEQLMNQCPHASAVLAKFSMLYQLGNRCSTPVKMILTSDYCLSLRMILLKYYIENDSSIEPNLEEFFQNFPPESIPANTNYLKRLVANRNLNSTLVFLLRNHKMEHTIKFLLQQGARINEMNTIHHVIIYLLSYTRSMIPFMLLDYSFYTNVPYEIWTSRHTPRMNLYICRMIQCGYPNEFRAKFDEFKLRLTDSEVKSIENFIDIKTPPYLWKLCLQKLRNSLKDLGDETIDKLKDHLPIHLRQSITFYGYDECRSYFQSVVLLP